MANWAGNRAALTGLGSLIRDCNEILPAARVFLGTRQ